MEIKLSQFSVKLIIQFHTFFDCEIALILFNDGMKTKSSDLVTVKFLELKSNYYRPLVPTYHLSLRVKITYSVTAQCAIGWGSRLLH